MRHRPGRRLEKVQDGGAKRGRTFHEWKVTGAGEPDDPDLGQSVREALVN